MNKTILLVSTIILAINIQINAQNKTEKPLMVKGLKSYVFIPQGKALVEKKEVEVSAFFISKYEVSNLEYREFLDSLKKNNETEKLKYAQVDTIQWNKMYNYKFNEPLVIYYDKHPAYNHYPVVNVSYEGAILYCRWLTQKYKLINKDKSFTYEFDLPNKQQWIRAARGNKKTEYAWDSPRLLGDVYFCNFKNLGAENIHYNPETKKYEIVDTFLNPIKSIDITAPVKSYYPNTFELYNMCGNVAEMIGDKGTAMGGSWNDSGYDVRVESEQKYQNANPYVGFRPIMTLIRK
jgi:sulfatase modifying factor 1